MQAISKIYFLQTFDNQCFYTLKHKNSNVLFSEFFAFQAEGRGFEPLLSLTESHLQ